jgi:uncharacterized protein (DUF486 family)
MPRAPTTQRSSLRSSVAATIGCTLDIGRPVRLNTAVQPPEFDRDDPSDDLGPSDADRASFHFQRIFKGQPLLLVIIVSWLIAFFEYCLAVPANRYGNAVYSAAELKTIQEVLTLSVFAIFSVLYLKEPIGLNQVIGFAFIALGAFFVFSGRA